MADNIQQQVLQVTQTLEKQVDAAIDHIENLDLNDLEQLRKQRMQELKTKQNKRQEWLQMGHGNYEQLTEEKMFFDAIKKSDNVIIHFFTPTNTRSPIVDKHFKILAPKHIETKFVSLNAEKCPFLAERLKIKVIPTLVCINKGIMVDKIVGFTTLGNRDDFTTEILEWRLAQNKVLDYEGDLSAPPDQQYKKENQPKAHTIKNGIYDNESDDDLEIEDHSHEFKDRIDIFSALSSGSHTYNQSLITPEEALELGIGDEDQEK